MIDKNLFGTISLIIALVAYTPYFINLWKRRIHPHAFSYGVWAVLSGMAFYAQLLGNAGPGAWAVGITALACLVISIKSYLNEGLGMTGSDWLSLAGIVCAVPLWYFTDDPLPALVLLVVIDALGFYPTFRRNYFNPRADMLFMYAMSGLKFSIALLAIENYSALTVLYPAYLFSANALFVLMVLVRRNIVGSS